MSSVANQGASRNTYLRAEVEDEDRVELVVDLCCCRHLVCELLRGGRREDLAVEKGGGLTLRTVFGGRAPGSLGPLLCPFRHRFDGVVGYHIRLTLWVHERSPVRTRVEPFLLVFFPCCKVLDIITDAFYIGHIFYL